jgi:uncharacterized protein (TIGR00730 family)
MNCIAVFCASSDGHDKVYKENAFQVGQYLAKKGVRVVYGGSQIGLMGSVADGALSEGGEVVGVLPDFMEKRELAHRGLTDLIIVKSMQERKLRMHELSDGVIALPGGFGTFEELFEMLTWGQLGFHQKPIGALNTLGYYHHLCLMIDHMKAQGLLKPAYAEMLLVADEIAELFQLLEDYIPVQPIIKMKADQA